MICHAPAPALPVGALLVPVVGLSLRGPLLPGPGGPPGPDIPCGATGHAAVHVSPVTAAADAEGLPTVAAGPQAQCFTHLPASRVSGRVALAGGLCEKTSGWSASPRTGSRAWTSFQALTFSGPQLARLPPIPPNSPERHLTGYTSRITRFLTTVDSKRPTVLFG